MTVIAVAGTASRSLPPERGTVRLRVVGEGATRDEAAAPVRLLVARLSAEVRALEASGRVQRWSAGSISTSVEHRMVGPDDHDERVHVVSAPFEVRFGDLDALPVWVGTVLEQEAARIDDVAWTVTGATRRAVTAELRAEAVRDATARAADYAAALGCGEVRAERLWEAGLRPEHRGDGWTAQARAMSASWSDGRIELHPAPSVIEVRITADFVPVTAAG